MTYNKKLSISLLTLSITATTFAENNNSLDKNIFIYNNGSTLTYLNGTVENYLEQYLVLEEEQLFLNNASKFIDMNTFQALLNEKMFEKIIKNTPISNYHQLLNYYYDSGMTEVYYTKELTQYQANIVGVIGNEFLIENQNKVFKMIADDLLLPDDKINDLLEQAESEFSISFSGNIKETDTLELMYQTQQNTIPWSYQYDVFIEDDILDLHLYANITNNDNIDYLDYNFYLVSGDVGHQKQLMQNRGMMFEARAMSVQDSVSLNESTVSLNDLHITPLNQLQKLNKQTSNRFNVGTLLDMSTEKKVSINDSIHESQIINSVDQEQEIGNQKVLTVPYDDNEESLSGILPTGNVSFYESKKELNDLPMIIYQSTMPHTERKDLEFSMGSNQSLIVNRIISDVSLFEFDNNISTRNLLKERGYFAYESFTLNYEVDNRSDKDELVNVKSTIHTNSYDYSMRQRYNIKPYNYTVSSILIDGNRINYTNESTNEADFELIAKQSKITNVVINYKINY
jgi:hypothetical protein